MKNWFKYFACCLAIAPFFSLKAQRPSFEPSAQLMVYGSQIDGDKYGGYDKGNVAFYIQTERANKKLLQWAIGLGYAQRGSVRKADPDNGVYTQYKIALGYISAPVKLILKQKAKRNKPGLYAETGFELLTLISATESDEIGRIDDREPFQRFTTDALLNLGLQQKNWSVFIGFRYSLLPARILENTNLNYDSNLLQFNNVVGVGIKRNF
jgi:hypothetical protein